MSDVEEVRMDDEPFNEPTPFNGKGKEKLIEGILTTPSETLPWVEKYRPENLEDVVSHQDITSTIDNLIGKNQLPHLLFYGPPGTGKTSMILAIARRIYGKAFRKYVLELNASDDRGIDVVREQIKNFAETRTLFSKGYKLIILDEADMMTTAAQAALRRVIEYYTRNVRFCIICNYVNKIIPAIQSRCTRFRFTPLPIKEVEKKLDEVVEKEGVKITTDAKAALLKLSKGDMRRVLNVLQACHAGYDNIDEDAVYESTATPRPSDIDAIVRSMMVETVNTSFEKITGLMTDRGLALQDLIGGMYEYIDTIDFPPHTRVYLLDQIATVEHRLSTGGDENLQLTALLATFKTAVELSAPK